MFTNKKLTKYVLTIVQASKKIPVFRYFATYSYSFHVLTFCSFTKYKMIRFTHGNCNE